MYIIYINIIISYFYYLVYIMFVDESNMWYVRWLYYKFYFGNFYWG